MVGGSLQPEQHGCVSALELHVHLQAAVVGRVRVVPGALEAVDAEPRQLVRGVLGAAPRRRGERTPGFEPSRGISRRVLELAGERSAHHSLPVPRLVTVVLDAAPDEREVDLGGRRVRRGRRFRVRPRIGLQGGCACERREGARARQKECELVPHSKIPPDPRRPLDCAAVEGSAGCSGR